MIIKIKINEIIASLKWTIKHDQGDLDLQIKSNPVERTHTIYIPKEGVGWREIEYLHELAHGVLAEKEHYLIGTSAFLPTSQREDIESLVNAVQTAGDWFADDLLMQWVPDQKSAYIREHVDYSLGDLFADDLFMQWVPDQKSAYIREHVEYSLIKVRHDLDLLHSGGLLAAQGVCYLGDKIHTIPRRYRRIVEVLLATNPGHPSLAAHCSLVNSLAAITTKSRIKPAKLDGWDVWEIIKVK